MKIMLAGRCTASSVNSNCRLSAPERVREEKGVITVAIGTYVPFEYRDDDNNIVGFDIDLAQYIADKLGVDMEVTDMEFQSIVPSIQNGEYDFSIAAMYKTDERCEVVDMSKSYCDSGMILAVKEDSKYADTIKSLADAYGHFPRPSGPRSPARQGHIKRPVLRLAEPSFLRPANQCC